MMTSRVAGTLKILSGFPFSPQSLRRATPVTPHGAGCSGDAAAVASAVKPESAEPAEAAAESSDDDDFGDALDTAGDELPEPDGVQETVAEDEDVEEEPPEDLRRVDPPCPAVMQELKAPNAMAIEPVHWDSGNYAAEVRTPYAFSRPMFPSLPAPCSG